MTTKYTLVIDKDKAKLKLLITANDGGHAQAQAADISRALRADKFYLVRPLLFNPVKEGPESILSPVFLYPEQALASIVNLIDQGN